MNGKKIVCGVLVAVAMAGGGIVGGMNIANNQNQKQITNLEQQIKNGYTEEQVQERVDSAVQDAREEERQFADERVGEAYNQGVEVGFNQGLNYVPPVETVSITKYAEIEGAPSSIVSATIIKEYTVNENKKIVIDSSFAYLFNLTDQTFTMLASGSFISQINYLSENWMITYGSSSVRLWNLETCKYIEIDKAYSFAFCYEVAENTAIVGTYFGTYKIDTSAFTVETLTSENGTRNISFLNNGTLYYTYSADSLVLKSVSLTDFSTSNLYTFKNKYFTVALNDAENGHVYWTSTSGNGVVDQNLTTFGVEVIAETANVVNLKYVHKSGNLRFFGAVSNSNSLFIVNVLSGSVTTNSVAWNAGLKFEDENIVVLGSMGTYSGVTIVDKSTLSIKYLESATVKTVFKMANGYLISGNSDTQSYYVSLEDLQDTKLSSGNYDTIKQLDEDTYQLTNSADESVVALFDESVVSLLRFQLM